MKIWKIAATPIKYNWKDVDWEHKTNKQIAEEIGANVVYVSDKRRDLAKKTIAPKRKYNPEDIDFTKPSVEIMNEIGISPMALWQLRKKFAPNTIKRTNRIYPQPAWKDVDWEHKTDKQIAEELGFSPDYISFRRGEFARDTMRVHYRDLDIDWNKSNKQIMEETGISYGHIIKLRREKAPNTSTWKKYNLDGIDWTKSNKEISIERNIPYTYVVKLRSLKFRDVEHENENYKYDYNQIDFSKPYKQIAEEYGMTPSYAWELKNDRKNSIVPITPNQEAKQKLDIALSQSWYRIAKQEKKPLTPQERQQVKERFGDNLECSFAKDKDGYYCYTHRARSKSYPSIDKIPLSKFEFISSTS